MHTENCRLLNPSYGTANYQFSNMVKVYISQIRVLRVVRNKILNLMKSLKNREHLNWDIEDWYNILFMNESRFRLYSSDKQACTDI